MLNLCRVVVVRVYTPTKKSGTDLDLSFISIIFHFTSIRFLATDLHSYTPIVREHYYPAFIFIAQKSTTSKFLIKEKENTKERKKMPGACTKRPRNHDDPQLSPDESFPPSRTQTRRDKTQSVGHGNNKDEDEDDETSTDPSSSDSSSVDSSSEDDDDNEEQEQEQKQQDQEENSAIPSLQTRQKPRIHRVEKNNDILSRITAFLPQMKTANEDLERELAAGRGKEVQLDDADEQGDGRYIEMVCLRYYLLLCTWVLTYLFHQNLGLGVLEEKRPGDEDYDPSSSDDEDEEMEHAHEHGQGQQSTETQLPSRPKDSRVLGKLMGEKKGEAKKPTIEEMKD